MLTESEKDDLSRLITATYEVLGQAASAAAVNMMVGDLAEYSVDAINNALTKCRREVKGRFNLAEIINRIDSDDGRLSANEAWALACSLQDEAASGACTNEIMAALDISKDCHDQVAARMAFIEAYKRIIDIARNEGKPSQWFMSLGHDKAGRVPAIEKAVAAGRISQDRAQQLLPGHTWDSEGMQRSLGGPKKVFGDQFKGLSRD